MTREEIRLQVAISVIQGVLEAKHGVIGEVVPSVAVAVALRIADAFVEEWYLETKEQKPAGGSSEKPNSQWSEEDERMRYYVTEAVQIRYSDKELAKYLNSEIIREKRELKKKIFNWLRSLHPQPHWKPSDEQMEALKRVFYNRPICSAELNNLESLYNDIKKL